MLAVIAWVVFNTVGIRANGLGNYLKTNLFPPGVPAPLYVLLTPIEFLSTFVLRPITLTIRLMANMMSGHFLLVLFYAGATYLLFHAAAWLKPFGVVSAGLGFVFVLFEMLVEFLQAYIFTLLVAVYIQLAMSAEH
jgi:F-type H+-transporting ATPase subunit a